MLDVLGALGGPRAVLGRLVDVPELDPPVEQERVVGHLVRRQLRRRVVVGAVAVHGVDAVGPRVGAGLLRLPGGHLHVGAIEHGARGLEVAVAQEVVVDVRVELLARVARVGLCALGMRHGAHDGGAVDGAVAGIHGGHVGQLLALHRDAGRAGGEQRRRGGPGAMGAVIAIDALCSAVVPERSGYRSIRRQRPRAERQANCWADGQGGRGARASAARGDPSLRCDAMMRAAGSPLGSKSGVLVGEGLAGARSNRRRGRAGQRKRANRPQLHNGGGADDDGG